MVETKSQGPSVVLSHGGVQYSYQLAFALQEAGFLKAFWTTYYHDNGWGRFFLPRYLGRRHHEGLNKELVYSIFSPELFQRALTFSLGKNYFTTVRTLHWRNRLFDRNVSRRLGRFDFDLFIGLSGSSLYSLEKAKSLGKVLIVDQHDIHYSLAARLLHEERELHPEFADSMPYWPPLEPYLEKVRREFEIADFILAPSTFALNSHLEAGIPREKLILMPHALRSFDPSAASFRKNDGKFRILFVGTLTQRKGLKYLLEAVRGLAHPRIELILIGDRMASREALAPYRDYFRHLGYLTGDELKQQFRNAHLLVLPSVYDAFGLVVLEAMAAGLPVIVSENTAAGSDVVRNETDGFVVPIRDVEVLKDRINRLYENPSLREEMGRNASERVKEFSWQAYRTRLKKTLENIYAA